MERRRPGPRGSLDRDGRRRTRWPSSPTLLDSTTSEEEEDGEDEDNHDVIVLASKRRRRQMSRRVERQPLNLETSPASSKSATSVDTDDLVRHLQDPTLPGRPKKKAKGLLALPAGGGDGGRGGGSETTPVPHSNHIHQQIAAANSLDKGGKCMETDDHFALPDADDDDDDTSDEAERSDNSSNSRSLSRSNSRNHSNKAVMAPRTVQHCRPIGKENHLRPTNRSPATLERETLTRRRSLEDPGQAPPPPPPPSAAVSTVPRDRVGSKLDPSSRNPYLRPLARKPPPQPPKDDDDGSVISPSTYGPSNAFLLPRADSMSQQKEEECEPETDENIAERAFFQVGGVEPVVVREGLRRASSYDEDHEPRSSFGFRNPHRGNLLPPSSVSGCIDLDDIYEYSDGDEEERDERAFGFGAPRRRTHPPSSPTLLLPDDERRVDQHPAPSTTVRTTLWPAAAPLSQEARVPAEAPRLPPRTKVLANSLPRWDASSVLNGGHQSRRQPLLRDAAAADTANAAAVVVASRRNRRPHSSVASTHPDPTGPTWTTAAYRPSHRPPSPGGGFNLGTDVLAAAVSQRNDLRGGSGSGVGGLTFDDPLPESRRAPNSSRDHHSYYDNTDTEDYGFDDASGGTGRRGGRSTSAGAPARSSGRGRGGRRVASRQRSTTGRGRGRGRQRGRSSGRGGGAAARGAGTRGRSSAVEIGRSWGSHQSSTDVRSASRDDPNLQHVGGAEMSF